MYSFFKVLQDVWWMIQTCTTFFKVCNNATFSVSFLKKNYISINYFLFKHTHWQHYFKTDRTLTATRFIKDIPSQMHPSPKPLWRVSLISMFSVASKGNKVLANSLYSYLGIWNVFQGLVHIDLQDDLFPILIL